MKIINNDLKRFIDEIEEEKLTVLSIDRFGDKVSEYGILEMFKLIEDGKIDFFPLKVYSTVYDSKKVSFVAKEKGDDYVDSILAAMWKSETANSEASEIVQAMLGFVIFGSDFIKRLRRGYKILSYNENELTEQINKIICVLSSSIKNNDFYKTITQLGSSIPNDFDLEANDDKRFNSVKKIKRIIEVSDLVIAREDQEQDQLIYKKEYNDISLDNISFLSEEQINYLTKTAEKEKKVFLKNNGSLLKQSLEKDLTNEDLDPLMMNYEPELEENDIKSGIADKVKNVFSINKKDRKTVCMKNLRNKKKNNSLKLTIILLIFVVISAVGIIASIKHQNVIEDTSIAEKVIVDSIDHSSEKFNIERTGTNK